MKCHGRLALTLAVVVGALAAPAQGGTIQIAGTTQGSAPNAFGFYTRQDGGGSATAISGFQSLQGVSPMNFTFAFHDLQLTGLALQPTSFNEVFEIVPGASSFSFFVGGQEAGSGDQFKEFIHGDFLTGLGTARGTIHLNGVAGDPFFQDVLAQTGGTGVLQFTIDPFIVISPTGRIDFTGTISTPEPGSMTMLGLGAVCLAGFAWHRRKQRT